jgi:hypothetical protein
MSAIRITPSPETLTFSSAGNSRTQFQLESKRAASLGDATRLTIVALLNEQSMRCDSLELHRMRITTFLLSVVQSRLTIEANNTKAKLIVGVANVQRGFPLTDSLYISEANSVILY